MTTRTPHVHRLRQPVDPEQLPGEGEPHGPGAGAGGRPHGEGGGGGRLRVPPHHDPAGLGGLLLQLQLRHQVLGAVHDPEKDGKKIQVGWVIW